MWDYFWHVVTETSQRDGNELDFAGGGDVRLKLCCSFKVISSMKHLAFFLFVFAQNYICEKEKSASKERVTFASLLHVITTMSSDWICSVHWLKCSLLVVELFKTTNVPQSRHRPLVPGQSMLSLSMSDSKGHKWLTSDATIRSINCSANELDIHWCIV